MTAGSAGEIESRFGYAEALDCLNGGVDLEKRIVNDNIRAVNTLLRSLEEKKYMVPDAMPGPRVMRTPLVHGSVYTGDWDANSAQRKAEPNCIEKAWRLVVIEKERDQFQAAENLAAFLLKKMNRMPLNFFKEEESREVTATVQKAFEATDLKPSRPSEDIKRVVRDLGDLWKDYQDLRARRGLEALAIRASTLKTSIASKVSDTNIEIESRDYFGAYSNCAPFSEVSTRMARFLWCIGESQLQTKHDDGPMALFKKWGKGVYLEKNTKWVLMSRIASKAARFPETWHGEVSELLHQGANQSELAEELADCAMELLPPSKSEFLEPKHSSTAQGEETRSLRCLPALINAPGFQGILIEEKGAFESNSDTIVVDKQCIISPVCGRLGAAVLTAWQARQYGGIGGLGGSWKINNNYNLEHTDCTASSSDSTYVCYDYSHRCFPEAMKFMCHMLPDCCPSLYNVKNGTHRCHDLSDEAFTKQNSQCDVCIGPAAIFPLGYGGSFMNWVGSGFGLFWDRVQGELKAFVEGMRWRLDALQNKK